MSITFAKGFKAAGVHCGIKKKNKDLALIVSDSPATCAGVFTTNLVHATCVDYTRKHVNGGVLQAIVVNSGCANCLTGAVGVRDNERMGLTVAEVLGVPEPMVGVASTGVIGAYLPIDKVMDGIKAASNALSYEGGDDAHKAILTTDTVQKSATAAAEIGGKTVKLGAICKGSGMIAPNMATMLAFFTTDVKIAQDLLNTLFTECIDRSLNCVDIDGDSSTNDMAIIMANGASGAEITALGSDYEIFKKMLIDVSISLAKQIASDGEGATKLIEINVTGNYSASELRKTAKVIAESPLVKTAMYGADPNWGRVLAAAGRSGIPFDYHFSTLSMNGVVVFKNGVVQNYSEAELHASLKGKEIVIDLALGSGNEKATVWTCDLSPEYVSINADYRT